MSTQYLTHASLVKVLCVFSLFCTLLPITGNAESKNTTGGFVDFNLYPYLSDVDSDSVFTINIAATLEHGFSYFSLTNFGNQPQASERGDTTTYYSEQNIRWRVDDSAFDLTAQFNLRSGADNDRHRLGIRWRLQDVAAFEKLFKRAHLSWNVNFHLLQFDDDKAHVWQIEHVFRLTVPTISDRLYLAGFIDHTFNETLAANIPSNPMVAELQLGYEVFDNFYAITEYRLNQYRRADVNNLALGLEYKIKW